MDSKALSLQLAQNGILVNIQGLERLSVHVASERWRKEEFCGVSPTDEAAYEESPFRSQPD